LGRDITQSLPVSGKVEVKTIAILQRFDHTPVSGGKTGIPICAH
jgi:hypothetical protein